MHDALFFKYRIRETRIDPKKKYELQFNLTLKNNRLFKMTMRNHKKYGTSVNRQSSLINLGIVCPMANELDTAESFIKEVLEKCRSFEFNTIKFFVILDNASKDGTVDLVQQMSKEINEVIFIFAPENKCVVDAYIRGYREALSAKCDWILEIDAGYSHQPNDILKFFETMIQGYDCVFGSRFCSGGRFSRGSVKRYIISRSGTILATLLLGTKLHDMTSGFELFTHDALQEILKIGINSRGPFFQTEIKTYAHKFKITEVPILYQAPSHNITGNVLKDAFSNLWRLFRLRLVNAI